jgi:hypothetical protein
VDANDVKNLNVFPYVTAPFSGYTDTHGGLNPKHS